MHPLPDLTRRILDMAKTGVYRELVFEALQPVATKKAIRRAIAQAKQFGLYSVPSLRDDVLGTYYQLDINKYSALQHRLDAGMPYDEDELMNRAIATAQALTHVLLIARAIALALFIGGLGCWAIGQRDASAGLLIGAASATGIWALQNRIATRR